MFTPQEIQEKTFVKAVFGGYDMATVDEFLEPLTADYITLYKENAVLKSKMKVLVEKLEEYRAQEQSMRKAMVSAQRTADAMLAEAEKKCARIVNEAEATASSKTADISAATKEQEAAIHQEEERLDCAKKTAMNFIDVLEKDIKGHLELLEKLKQQDFLKEEAQAHRRPKAFDFEEADHPVPIVKKEAAPAVKEEQPLVVPKVQPEKAETTEDIANEIEQNLSRQLDLEEHVVKEDPSLESTIKFTNLQFGRSYDPTSK